MPFVPSLAPSIVVALLSVRSSACPVGTFGNVSVLALFHSGSSRLLVWLGQGHLLCSICMPRDVPRVRLGGVRATRLHASGTDDSRLLLGVRDSGGSCSYASERSYIARLARCCIVPVLAYTHAHTHSYSRS